MLLEFKTAEDLSKLEKEIKKIHDVKLALDIKAVSKGEDHYLDITPQLN